MAPKVIVSFQLISKAKFIALYTHSQKAISILIFESTYCVRADYLIKSLIINYCAIALRLMHTYALGRLSVSSSVLLSITRVFLANYNYNITRNYFISVVCTLQPRAILYLIMKSELSSCHTTCGSLENEDVIYEDIDIAHVNLDVPVPVPERSKKLFLLSVWRALKRYMNTKLYTLCRGLLM